MWSQFTEKSTPHSANVSTHVFMPAPLFSRRVIVSSHLYDNICSTPTDVIVFHLIKESHKTLVRDANELYMSFIPHIHLRTDFIEMSCNLYAHMLNFHVGLLKYSNIPTSPDSPKYIEM